MKQYLKWSSVVIKCDDVMGDGDRTQRLLIDIGELYQSKEFLYEVKTMR